MTSLVHRSKNSNTKDNRQINRYIDSIPNAFKTISTPKHAQRHPILRIKGYFTLRVGGCLQSAKFLWGMNFDTHTHITTHLLVSGHSHKADVVWCPAASPDDSTVTLVTFVGAGLQMKDTCVYTVQRVVTTTKLQ